jgi:hypothetical protein
MPGGSSEQRRSDHVAGIMDAGEHAARTDRRGTCIDGRPGIQASY